jgi:hypothetical protein
VVVEVKLGKQAPKPPGIDKNGAKNGWFPALIGLKIAENSIFY